MKIKNIEDLKNNINRSTIFIFFIIFTTALVGLYLTHNQFIQKQALLNHREIVSAINTYKSNLSEKLSIIASSTVFLDYLRSGNESRDRLYSQFLSQMSSLKSKSISGMQLIDPAGKIIFNYGDQTSIFTTLKLCYLDQTLDPEMGDCRFLWKLYFRGSDLLNDILSMNNSIQICSNCTYYNFFDNEFGSFPIKSNSDYKVNLNFLGKKDYFFYIYLLLMSVTLILFGSWSWYRLNYILNNYIANPIKNLTNCLMANNSLNQTNDIEEIKFLIDEINSWRKKLNKIQLDEKNTELAAIAAQVAHDIRSPLTAIDMLIRNLMDIPEDYRIMLHAASQRISDIANNFLLQYKMPLFSSESSSSINNEYIPSILECMISEKRSQYIDRDIKLKFSIANYAWDTFSFINASDFKRVLSNLINNSIEAIDLSGYVEVSLKKYNGCLIIDIADNGCGIPADLLPKIMEAGLSFGKKNGSGLGLSHAKKMIEGWHGNLGIKSGIGKGTSIEINLPLSNEFPDWFKSSLTITDHTAICVFDDEAYIHELWKIRFNEINNLDFYSTIEEFKNCTNNLSSTDIIYLIDYDLGYHLSNGLDVIEKYNIIKNAILVTNRYDDKEIQARCITSGIKIIPKHFIPHIPILHPVKHR